MLLPTCPKNYLLPSTFYSICAHCSISNKIAGPIKLQWCQSNNCWNSKLGLDIWDSFFFTRCIIYILGPNSWQSKVTWETAWHFEVGFIRTLPGAVVEDLRLGRCSFGQLNISSHVCWWFSTCPDVGQRQLCQGTSGVSQPLARELRKWPRTLSLVLSLVLQSRLRTGRWE